MVRTNRKYGGTFDIQNKQIVFMHATIEEDDGVRLLFDLAAGKSKKCFFLPRLFLRTIIHDLP